MKAVIILVLVLAVVCGAVQEYSIRAISSHVRSSVKFKKGLYRAYSNHIKDNELSNHMVALVVDNDVVLTWTDSASEDTIRLTIDSMQLTEISATAGPCSSVSYARILEATRSPDLQGKTTTVYLVVDNVDDSSSSVEAITASNKLVHEDNVKVYPMGIGSCIVSKQLKRIAGPCHPVFGCHPPFSYYQSRDYAGIHRAAAEIEEQTERDALKRTVTTNQGLTTGQLIAGIVSSVIVGMMAITCVVYSACYVPQRMSHYTVWNEDTKKTDLPPRVYAGPPSFVTK